MTSRPSITLALLLLSWSLAQARIALPSILSDHMVLQQQAEVTLWGWSTQSNDDVQVWASWGDDTVKVPVRGGRWEAQLRTPEAGGPHQLFLMDRRGEKTVIDDVLIGEVWLASGQSNMEMRLDSTSPSMRGVTDFRAEIAAADYPEIRFFQAERRTALTPQDDLQGQWVVCTPAEAAQFSAVGYFFAQTLHDSLQVPVGCIMSCWGGTQAEAWTPVDALAQDSVLAAIGNSLIAGQRSPRAPGILYNAMIHPLELFRIEGVIWYQGESNRGRPFTYRRVMTRLIEGWRAHWGYDFSFYFVQIAPYDYSLRGSPYGPYLREAQLQTLSVPQTGMVVTADLGDDDNIHPRRKRPIGERLARLALNHDYGFDGLVSSGPIYRRMRVEGERVIVSFDHAEGGLVVSGEQVNEAYLAGADRVFYPAQVTLQGSELVATSERVPEPVALRYGFSDTSQMNLYNQAGLPASPFRTDDWPPESVEVRVR